MQSTTTAGAPQVPECYAPGEPVPAGYPELEAGFARATTPAELDTATQRAVMTARLLPAEQRDELAASQARAYTRVAGIKPAGLPGSVTEMIRRAQLSGRLARRGGKGAA